MSDKGSMIMYHDWINIFNELSDAEAGKLVKALLVYSATGDEPDFKNKVLRMAFKSMQGNIDSNNEKYMRICEKRKAAIEKRWNTKNTNEYKNVIFV